jgi:hypothetical protein
MSRHISRKAFETMQTTPERDLFLIDGCAPFFTPFINGERKNWSKAPLTELQKHGRIDANLKETILGALSTYCRKVRDIGYTAITFDDLAHLTLFDFYPYMLSRTVHSYQEFFRQVFAIAADAGLQIYITTDIMFWNRFIETHVRRRDTRMRALFAEAVERLFDLFPEVSGIVTRIGESDGVDVNSLFKSRMVIRSPRQCNRWLKEMLPVFEAHGKTLIFRTWGLGAFRVGDIIWNETTEKQAFGDIDSPAFVVSRKYAAADFFRYLPLNERIIHSHHPHIVEFQARREYEGFGVFPAYIGRQYQEYRDQLVDNHLLRGICVWCQTGGWSHFDRLTFLDNSSAWNELNTVATLQLFTSARSADEILHAFCEQRFRKEERDTLMELVHLYDRLIDQIWYFAPFARQPLWFRRLRVPPLLWIFWDTILVNHALRLVFRTFMHNPKAVRINDKKLRSEIRQLRTLSAKLSKHPENLLLGADTFELLYTLRHFYLGKAGHKREKKVCTRLKKYHTRHPGGFLVECDFSPFRIRGITTGVLFSIIMRTRPQYRLLDRFLLIPLTCWMFPLVKRWQRHRIPDLAERQAVGLEVFFR